jgi:hypothetical protein
MRSGHLCKQTNEENLGPKSKERERGRKFLNNDVGVSNNDKITTKDLAVT